MALNFAGATTLTAAGVAVASLDASGVLSVPNRPICWLASGTVVTWGGVEFDTRNNFTADNGRFTASVAGYYFFKYHQLVNYATAGEYRAIFRLNGTAQWGRSIFYKINSNVFSTIQVEARIYLNVGDYVDVYIESAPAPMAADQGWGNFQGYRI